MAQNLYRVVEAQWKGGSRIEVDIGCAWKPEAKAKEEMRELAKKSPSRTFSLQKKA